MTTTPEATSYHSSRKFSIVLALRAIQNLSFHYETPCSSLSCPNVRLVQNYYQKVANKSMSCLVICLEQQHGVLLTEKHICTTYLSMQYIPFNGQPFETRNTYILALRATTCLFFSYKLGIYSSFQSLFLNACIQWHDLILCIIMVTTEVQDHLVYSVVLLYYHTIIRYDEIQTIFTSFNQQQQKQQLSSILIQLVYKTSLSFTLKGEWQPL